MMKVLFNYFQIILLSRLLCSQQLLGVKKLKRC